MKKRFLIMVTVILCLAMMLSACGAAEKDNESGGPPPAQSADAASQGEVKVTIAPPTGWDPVAGSVIPVHYVKNSASFMVKSESFQSKNIDEVVEEAMNAFTGAFDDVTYQDGPETITVDGKDARKIGFTCKVGGMEMKYETVYLFAGNCVYAITFADMANTFDALSADYQQTLADIRFN